MENSKGISIKKIRVLEVLPGDIYYTLNADLKIEEVRVDEVRYTIMATDNEAGKDEGVEVEIKAVVATDGTEYQAFELYLSPKHLIDSIKFPKEFNL